MAANVFWSWQSDHPEREGHYFVRDALKEALDQVAIELQLEERPNVDHDTKGVPGLAPITDVIFEKIGEAAVFVADVTPICQTGSARYVPNPNVMIELGYALRALDWKRIILVWNAAYPGCAPEHLPFDLRHRRAPIQYTLKPGASAAERAGAQATLISALKQALLLSLRAHEDTQPLSVGEIPADQVPVGARGAWASDEALQGVAVRFGGNVSLRLPPGPRVYMRIIPSTPAALEIDDLQEGNPQLPLLGRFSVVSWGRTSGGFLSYVKDEQIEGVVFAAIATKYVRKTGELWGVSVYGFREHEGRMLAFPAAVGRAWREFLSRGVAILLASGAKLPFRVIAGALDIGEAVMPSEWPSDARQAIESSVELDRVIRKPEDIEVLTLELWNEIRAAFALRRQSADEMAQALAEMR